MPELAHPPGPRAPTVFPHPRKQENHAAAATILLVEDSRLAAEAIRVIAQRSGLRLRRVETLAAARAHLCVYRPDAVLIDLGLPDGSGLELISELACSARRPAHLAALSGDPQAREAALSAGADAFVVKPFDCSTIAGCMIGLPPHATPPDTPVKDSLAFLDDLRRARRLLGAAPDGKDPARSEAGFTPVVQAACRFVIGVARCGHDDALLHAAEAVLAEKPESAAKVLNDLHAMLDRRLCRQPLI